MKNLENYSELYVDYLSAWLKEVPNLTMPISDTDRKLLNFYIKTHKPEEIYHEGSEHTSYLGIKFVEGV